MLRVFYNKTAGDLFLPTSFNRKRDFTKSKHALPEEKVIELKNKPVKYEISKYPAPENQVFFFDGEKVTIDFEKFADISYFRNTCYKDLKKKYDELLEILNGEQLYYCPYCHVIDTVSSLAINSEHEKYQCHTGHYDRFFWDHSAFTPASFSKLPKKIKEWETKSIEALGRPRISPTTDYNTKNLIERFDSRLATDLGIETYNGGYRNKYFT